MAKIDFSIKKILFLEDCEYFIKGLEHGNKFNLKGFEIWT